MHRLPMIWAGLVAIAAGVLSGCSAAPADPASETVATQSIAPTQEPTQSGSSATQGFREWLAASRAPDPALACGRLSPALSERMVAEINATGPAHVENCEQMITATAALYRAAGQSAEVDIDVRHETATDATLFVTYAGSGDCGTVVMKRSGTTWMLTEQSEECAG